jgi:hypothetical protein
MNDNGSDTSPQSLTWLRREWLAARLVVVLGFAIAIGVGTYFALQPAQQASEAAAPDTSSDETPPPMPQETPAQREEVQKQAHQLCLAALASAKQFGILPQFANLAAPMPSTTAVSGRYTCLAATDAAKYTVTVDAICPDLTDTRCSSLFSVTGEDGASLYQRQE